MSNAERYRRRRRAQIQRAAELRNWLRRADMPHSASIAHFAVTCFRYDWPRRAERHLRAAEYFRRSLDDNEAVGFDP